MEMSYNSITSRFHFNLYVCLLVITMVCVFISFTRPSLSMFKFSKKITFSTNIVEMKTFDREKLGARKNATASHVWKISNETMERDQQSKNFSDAQKNGHSLKASMTQNQIRFVDDNRYVSNFLVNISKNRREFVPERKGFDGTS